MFYCSSQTCWMSSTGSTSVLHSSPVTVSPSFCEYQPSSKELDVIHIPTHSLDVFEARLPRLISVSQVVCTELAKDESQSSYFVLTSALAAWWCFGLVLCVYGFHAACVFLLFFHLFFLQATGATLKDPELCGPGCQHFHLVITELMICHDQQRTPNPQHACMGSRVCPLPVHGLICLRDTAAFCRSHLQHGLSSTQQGSHTCSES